MSDDSAVPRADKDKDKSQDWVPVHAEMIQLNINKFYIKLFKSIKEINKHQNISYSIIYHNRRKFIKIMMSKRN
jgi:hypothetical protein